jgi:hypothetical protein
MASHLLGLHFDGGVQMPHFVNGRLLTADDLKSDQDAMLTRLRYLGRAAGYGVVEGLFVTPAAGANNLAISGGIGVNRAGDLIRLSEAGAQISLLIPPDTGEFGEDAGRFHDCGGAPPGPPSGAGINKGAYLLTVRPISRLEGSAPVKSIRGNLAVCESKWEVDGLEFVAIPLTKFTTAQYQPLSEQSGMNNGTTLRNLLAHWCFGSEGLKLLPTNPFEFGLKQYLNLHPANLDDLTDCDLPLAVFTWTEQGLGILDNWAARRRIVYTYPAVTWDAFLSDARVAEAQARFLQFQEQLEAVRANDKPATVAAAKYFRYLPPVGLLPIVVPANLVARAAQQTLAKFFALLKATDFVQVRIHSSDQFEAALDAFLAMMTAQSSKTLADKAMPYFAGTQGFDLATFFGDRMPDRYGLADRETVEFTVNHSWYDEVIDLQEGDPFDILLVEDTPYRTLAALLFLMLDANQIQAKPGQSFLAANNFLDELSKLVPIVWKQTDLRERFYRTIAKDPAAAVQAIAEGRAPFHYAMFVKRIRPVHWISLKEEEEGEVPDGDSGRIAPEAATQILDRIAWAASIKVVIPPIGPGPVGAPAPEGLPGGMEQPAEAQPAEAQPPPSTPAPAEAADAAPSASKPRQRRTRRTRI